MGAAGYFKPDGKFETKNTATGLLPCPFCGGEAGVQKQVVGSQFSGDFVHKRIACTVCGVSGKEYVFEGEHKERAEQLAIDNWNKRA